LKQINAKQLCVFWGGILLGLTIIYFPLLSSGTLLNRDDIQIVPPLLSIHSFRDFFSYLLPGRSMDIQPVRDISLMADVLLQRWTGFPFFHLHNVLLWFCSGLIVFRIFQRFVDSAPLAMAATAAFTLHPMMVMTVGWISARKHILAFLFFLLALEAFFAWVESRRRAHWVLGFYLLSVLSQPILVFFPVWCALFLACQESLRNRLRSPLLLFLWAFMIAAVAANYLHYDFAYRNSPEARAALELSSFSPVGDVLLALGRYAWNIFVPWTQYGLLYSRESGLKFYGLAVCVLVVGLFGVSLGK
jgi:hypothetical protein